MSCDTSSRQFNQSAAKRNGVAGYAGKYLNSLGSWATYRDLDSVESIPGRLAELTEAFFGVKGLLSGKPRLAGILGAMLAVHAVEQASGAAATMGMRLFGRGKPVAQYRGVILREREPGQVDQTLEQASGGRLKRGKSFYFFESGRTWSYSTIETAVGDTARTLTTLRSFTLPGREFYFDRQLEPQQAVDIALGDRDPDTLPGFIGSINELENTAVPLGHLKRAAFLADWLLRDPTERDGGSPLVDYDLRGGPSSGGSGYDRMAPSPGSPSPAGGAWASPSSSSTPPSTSAFGRSIPISGSPSPAQAVSIRRAEEPPRPIPGLRPEPPPNFPEPTAASGNGAPTTLTLNIDGQDRQVVIERVMTDPIRQIRKAEARFYDPDLGAWRRVVDDGLRVELAKVVVYAQNK